MNKQKSYSINVAMHKTTNHKESQVLNQNQAVRDELLGIQPDAKYAGGVERFKNLTVQKLEQLNVLGFLDPADQQNYAPTMDQFFVFMQEYPRFTAHGYAVHKNREDYRVAIEGLELNKPTPAERLVFRKFIKRADTDAYQCSAQRCYCWFD
jgi:hypothetical protein